MKTGFSKQLDTILREYGLRTPNLIGGSLVGEKTLHKLRKMGYNVERGLNNPTYDYIVISPKYDNLKTHRQCLNKLNVGSVLVVIVNFKPLMFGVLIKRKDN